jgi:S-adenosylmethionine decarboxylase
MSSSNPTDIVELLFEGPEKKLIFDFKRSSSSTSRGLRNVDTSGWEHMLDSIGCKILSTLSNESMDSYVLSESSLFVYPLQVMLKTCGATTLLNCVPTLLRFAGEQGLEVEFVTYCRKNFMFPTKQLFPHTSFDSEIAILKKHLNGEGDAYVLGPVTGEHWYLYTCDRCTVNMDEEVSQTLEIMMTNLDMGVMRRFFKSDSSFVSAAQLTADLGLDQFLPGAVTDEWMFEPCGFSLNACAGKAYYTIHVTPEDTHSYVSFETNIESLARIDALIKHVLSVFRPGKFSVALFTDHAAKAVGAHHLDLRATSFDSFIRVHKTTTELEGDVLATLANYVLVHQATPKSRERFHRKGFHLQPSLPVGALDVVHQQEDIVEDGKPEADSCSSAAEQQ